MMKAYLKLMHESLKHHLPAIMASYQKQRRGDCRFDDANDFNNEVKGEFQAIATELEQKIHGYGLNAFIEKFAQMAQNNSIREWKRVIKDTLGIDLLDDYYKGDFYAEALRKWVEENVLKIQSIPKTMLSEMNEIVLNGYVQGTSIRDLQKQIQERYNINRSQAEMLARDQVSSLNSRLTQMQQKDAGCKRYRWSDSRDSRVRDCHRELNGKTFSWDDPPEMWYDTKTKGRVYTGRRCHPGEDFCCRCIAIPQFDIDTVDIPFKTKDGT